MKSKQSRISLLSILCVLLSVMLLAASCVSAPTGNGGSNETESDSGTRAPEAPTKDPNEDNGNGNGDNTPPANNTYTIEVKDNGGAPIEGLRAQYCNKTSGTCNPILKKTDATGKTSFTLADGDSVDNYYISITGYPTGSSGNKTQAYYFADGANALEITLVKYVVKADQNGTGLADVKIEVTAEGVSEAVAECDTAENGEAIFWLPAGTYSASVVSSPAGASVNGDSTVSFNSENKAQINYN